MSYSLDEAEKILTLFGSIYALIGLLGFQSQIVKNKEVVPAFFTSAAIGSLQLLIYKTTPDASLAESMAYILGGSMGLVSSIYAHNLWLQLTNKKESA